MAFAVETDHFRYGSWAFSHSQGQLRTRRTLSNCCKGQVSTDLEADHAHARSQLNVNAAIPTQLSWFRHNLPRLRGAAPGGLVDLETTSERKTALSNNRLSENRRWWSTAIVVL
jgi:hypothetical protein